VSQPDAALVVLYIPAAHAVQPVFFSPDANVPVGHSPQAVCVVAALNLPSVQSLQLPEVEPPHSVSVPLPAAHSQLLHSVLPAPVAYWPPAQSLQTPEYDVSVLILPEGQPAQEGPVVLEHDDALVPAGHVHVLQLASPSPLHVSSGQELHPPRLVPDLC
jgi:hypothetical protein